jgi:nitronate monooxygenase
MINTNLPPLIIRGNHLLPIIQGGMGIGVSAHKLAGHVAREGAVGTIASVELRRLHPDLLALTRRCHDHDTLFADNLTALDREIRAARRICGSKGFLAVNVMKALKHDVELVQQACCSGADAIIMGAGLPLDLPDIVQGYDDVALIPILSEIRGIRAVLKRWQRKNRLPDAIIIEHPRYAGGHLGAQGVNDLQDEKYDFKGIISAALSLFTQLGIPAHRIPLIAAGGIHTYAQVMELMRMGYSGVQVGTPFAVTTEGDAHPNFKKVLAEADADDIVTFMSTAGLPARAVLTPWLEKYLQRESSLCEKASPGKARCPRNLECLKHCGLKDGNPQAGQFCIETQLAAAQRGDIKRGLFFRGSEPLPFGHDIRPVHDLLSLLLTGATPEHRVVA